jgi:hypothetical protein
MLAVSSDEIDRPELARLIDELRLEAEWAMVSAAHVD